MARLAFGTRRLAAAIGAGGGWGGSGTLMIRLWGYGSEKSKEIVGKKFGRLTVSRYLGRRLKSRLKTGKIIWASVVEAIFKCGSIRKYDTWNLTSGQANSCGCVSDETK